MQEQSTEIPKGYDPREAETKWYRFWEEKGFFRAEDQSDKPPFCIVIPPPNITGELHMGHAVFVTLQDMLTRWKRMSGFNALWLPGTDHAGIATQMIVEKDLRRTENKSRHDLGREEFLRRVWAWKEKYGNRITEQMKVLGASCDWERSRFTLDEGLSRAVREAFVSLYEQGLIYRAQKLINWCPRCHTALSDLEVEHEETNGKIWHIAYPVKGTDKKLVVATTRPETMLGDTAVAVHPDDPRYKDLIGKMVVLPLVEREIPIIGDAELVSMEFGTGAVKVTPAHDFNDYATGQRHNLPMISIFDLAAKTNENAGAYQGLDRKQAREKVLADLEARGLLVDTKDHKLSIGKCQRCNDVVEPTLSPQWFVKIQPLAEPAIAAVEQGKTKFIPEQWTNTYFSWMRNIHDWCISRQLWWGHQIPAWYCGCGEVIVARDEPKKCPKCGSGELKRDEDVLDTWFSSGLWPFSTLGWPDQTKALATFYPTTVMETGHDIIFFWVARMMMFGLHFMDEVPFQTVFLHALVRDEKGDKMSKTKGNVIDPLDVVQGQPDAAKIATDLKKKFPKGMPAYGADALRFTLASLTAQGRDIKLSMERVEGYKNFANKIWNASRFALMNLGESPGEAVASEQAIFERPLSLADRWILARLNKAVAETVEHLEAFKFNEACNSVYQFVWREFCDWYIELSKGSLYGNDDEAKATTRAVLVYVLDQMLRLLHPFMPYVTEEIWQRLPRRTGDPESVMVADYPKALNALRDESAEREMGTVISAIEGIRSIRGESNISPALKIPAILHAPSPEVRTLLERNRSYIEPLSGLSNLQISAPGARPRLSATFVDPSFQGFVPLAGIVDIAEEIKRIEKEIGRTEADLQLLEKKLSNPNFVQRAPPDVVEKDRARVAELEQKRSKLLESVERIRGEEAMGQPEQKTGTEVAGPVPDADTARVRVQADGGGEVDLEGEMADTLADVQLPPGPDPVVADQLKRLRDGTREGLSKTDHYDLGVAYMGMGLVEDAVREFNQAGVNVPEEINKEGQQQPATAPAQPTYAAGGEPSAAPAAPVIVEAPAAKKAGKKAAAKKAGKKAAAKKAPAKKAAGKKPAAKKAAKKAGKTAAKKGAAKKGAAKKAGKKAAAKKGAAKKAAKKAGKKAAKKSRR